MKGHRVTHAINSSWWDEVAKHTTKGDCWVVVKGQVLNVTNFLKDHPGGELAILTFAGKDATEEFNMIHPPDVIPKYAPFAPIGTLGEGGGDDDDDDDDDEDDAGGASGYTMEEVAKHTTKGDCWVVVKGQVLNVTNFLKDHPGGELAILTFAGKDATEEFNMIHPPDVIPKYAPFAPIGVLGAGKPKKAKKAAGGAAPAKVDEGDMIANFEAWGTYPGADNWRQEIVHNPGVLLVNFSEYIYAFVLLWISILWEVCATIFTAKNIKISSIERSGLTRSAILLVLFMVIHGVGNLHVFMGPDDFNGYGYFYVRLYWTGFGLPANIVEEYILLSAMLHIFVGLIKTWSKRPNGVCDIFPKMNLGISGIILGTFMTIHLFQFRFGDTQQYFIRPPPMLISWYGIPHLNLFWTKDTAVPAVPVRDIYNLEYKLFTDTNPGFGGNNFWAYFYIFSVCVFMTHGCLGWQKVTASALGIPKKHIPNVQRIGYVIFLVLGAIYISFPLYCLQTKPFRGHQWKLQPEHPALIPGA